MSSCEIIEGITLHHGDCRDIMRALPADHFDAIITDPPYGIAGRFVSTCAYAKRVYILYACITAPPIGAGGLAFSVGKAPFHFMRCVSLPHLLR